MMVELLYKTKYTTMRNKYQSSDVCKSQTILTKRTVIAYDYIITILQQQL